MLSKLIAELILLTIMIFPHGTDNGRFEIANKSGNTVQVSFTRAEINSIVEGMHEYTVTVHSAEPEVIKYRFIDNGLYLVYKDINNQKDAYELDIIRFLTDMRRDTITKKQQVFKTVSGNDKIIVKPSDGNITLTLQKNKTETIIDRKYLNPSITVLF
ncbi:MAG TPA: hypothetical protein PKZ64_10305 [Spirochaetota bacterium]|nr:hypothetical protein [Spirochaetota bacterium]HPJ42528.1 hypothetical protein [Spirochaetota bacterium]HPR37484.1 hypothetical protein [Spirochaetota bacterium]